MDISAVSLLSATASILIIGAVCFAIGYLFASKPLLLRRSAPIEDDDDNNKKMMKTRTTGNALKNKGGGSLLRWSTLMDDDQKKKKPEQRLEIENLSEIIEDFKMVLVVRNELKMGKGKIAAQCSHATLGLYKKLLHKAPKALNRWEMCGQVKVVLKVESEEDMLVLQARAKSLNLPTHITIDAGRTQIAPNSRTVMAILGPDNVVDDVTGGLKLL